MFISVQELELRKIRIDVRFAPGQIDYLDGNLSQTGPLEVQGGAELGPNLDIRVRGNIRGGFAARCDRCLDQFDLAIDSGFDLLYEPDEAGPAGEEHGIARRDTETGYYTGAGLELSDVVREQVLLWLPMQRVCRPDCHGICAICGSDRNLDPCQCRPAAVDERWAPLKKLSLGD